MYEIRTLSVNKLIEILNKCSDYEKEFNVLFALKKENGKITVLQLDQANNGAVQVGDDKYQKCLIFNFVAPKELSDFANVDSEHANFINLNFINDEEIQ